MRSARLCRGLSISAAAQTTATPAPVISIARTVSAYSAFGDGDAVGYLLSSPSNAYPFLLGAALGTTTTVRGFAGGQSCDVPKAQVFHKENPGDQANPIYTIMIGTDDVLHGGPEPAYEAVAGLCRSAAITWLTTSSTSKYTGASFPSVPLGWSLDNSYAPNVVGLTSSTNGSVANWTVTTTGGPIALWYRIIDGNGGNFTYSVDGGSAIPVTNFTAPALKTVNGETDSVGVVIITGVPGSAGNPVNHIVSTTVTSATGATNIVSVLGVGTTPPAGATNPPYVWEAGVPFLGGNADAALTAAYNSDILAETTALSTLGFGISFVDVRAYMFGTPAEMADWVHPNDLGHQELSDAFYNSVTTVAGDLLPAETVTISDMVPGATIYYTIDGTTPTASSPVYHGPVTVFSSTTFQAVAIASGYSISAVASATSTITPLTATPMFSVAGGTYASAQMVSISDSTPGATVFYTTDHTMPTTASPVYGGPIPVSSDLTLKAVAVTSGYSPSIVGYAAYTITSPAAAPVFSVPQGIYGSAQVVSLSDGTPNAVIYYTTDGSTPTTTSSQYSGPITVSSTETINAFATASGYSSSAVASATYTIAPPAAAPYFSLAGGTYHTPQTLTLTDSTPNPTIYYTTTGLTPTTSSTVYSGPITISSTEMVQAVAIAPGFAISPVSAKSYTYVPPQAAAPNFSLVGGTYSTPQSLTLTDATPGAIIYYTSDGTTPTSNSAIFSKPITVSSTETLNATATASGYSISAVATASYTINLPLPDFSVVATPPALSLSAGQSGIITVAVAPTNGFNTAISFSCSGVPAGASCSFSPATATPSGSAASTTLTVATTASAASLHPNTVPLSSGAAFAAILCCIGWTKRRRLPMLFLIVAGILGLSAISACGGSPAGSRQPVTSTITVTATAGSLQHSTNVSLTVN